MERIWDSFECCHHWGLINRNLHWNTVLSLGMDVFVEPGKWNDCWFFVYNSYWAAPRVKTINITWIFLSLSPFLFCIIVQAMLGLLWVNCMEMTSAKLPSLCLVPWTSALRTCTKATLEKWLNDAGG